MITVENVKSYLNIDFTDNDDYLQLLLDAAQTRATSIIGVALDTSEVDNAILEDIATMYQSRGDASTVNQSSIMTYRRLSTRPMF
jgi:malate synthase